MGHLLPGYYIFFYTFYILSFTCRAHVLDGRLGESKPGRQARSGGFLRRSASSDSANVNIANVVNAANLANVANVGHHRHHHHHHYHHTNGHGHGYARDENRVPPASYTEEYDEIDQIYDYVRGFAPLPKSVRSPYESASLGSGLSAAQQTNAMVCNLNACSFLRNYTSTKKFGDCSIFYPITSTNYSRNYLVSYRMIFLYRWKDLFTNITFLCVFIKLSLSSRGIFS